MAAIAAQAGGPPPAAPPVGACHTHSTQTCEPCNPCGICRQPSCHRSGACRRLIVTQPRPARSQALPALRDPASAPSSPASLHAVHACCHTQSSGAAVCVCAFRRYQNEALRMRLCLLLRLDGSKPHRRTWELSLLLTRPLQAPHLRGGSSRPPRRPSPQLQATLHLATTLLCCRSPGRPMGGQKTCR